MLTVSRSAVDFSGLGGIWDGPSHSGNVYCGQMNQYFRYFFGRNGRRVLRTKEEKDHPDCYQHKSKSQGLSWYGVVSVPLGKGNLHFCDGTIHAEKYIEILEHNMLPSRRHLFQGRPWHISTRQCKTTFCTHYKVLAAEEEGTVLDWPACGPVLSPIENVWRILKRKMRQRRPRTVAHLKTCLQEEWDKITPETLHHLVSSVPKRLLSVVKRNGKLQSGKCFTVPTFFGMCCRSEWQERCILQMTWSWPDKTWNICVHIVCNEIQVKVNLEITTFFFICVFHTVPTFSDLGL